MARNSQSKYELITEYIHSVTNLAVIRSYTIISKIIRVMRKIVLVTKRAFDFSLHLTFGSLFALMNIQ